MLSHIAVKCAWKDMGYKTKCTTCPNTNQSCAQKAIHVTSRDCWERHIFERFEFGTGENRHIKGTEKDKIVVFTTKKPFSDHKTVFGISSITNIEKGQTYPEVPPFPAGWTDMVLINPTLTVVIPENIDVNFETFYKRRWNQGLFRYLTDKVVQDILFKVMFELGKIEGARSEMLKLAKLINLSQS